ncbi:hypothetical protein ACLOJK_023585 [Asimina triloba]
MDALGGPIQREKTKSRIKHRDLRQRLNEATLGVVGALELLPLSIGVTAKVVRDDQGSSISRNRHRGLTVSAALRPLRLHHLKSRRLCLRHCLSDFTHRKSTNCIK